MAENKNNFDATVASLFKGMDSFVSAKTVVGDTNESIPLKSDGFICISQDGSG